MENKTEIYIEANEKGFDKMHEDGWGNHYVDSSFVSLYFNEMRTLLKKNGKRKRALDFGCSLGINSSFLQEQGFDVYGIDISQTAIEKCVKQHGFCREKFVAANILQRGQEIWNLFPQVTFDLVIAANVLYYFTGEDIEKVLGQFDDVMSPDGVFYANMCTTRTSFLQHAEKNQLGMYEVRQAGSIHRVTYVNPIRERPDMALLFRRFSEKGIFHSQIEASREMYMENYHFVGVKR